MSKHKTPKSRHSKQLVSVMVPGQAQPRSIGLGDALDAVENLAAGGKTLAAIKLLQQLIKQDKGQQAFLLLINILVSQGWYAEAYDYLMQQQHEQQQQEKFKPSAEIENLRGLCAFRLLDIKSAYEHFSQACKLDAGNYYGLHNIGLCYAARGNREKATAFFSQALKRKKDHFDSYLMLAPLLAEEQRTSYRKKLSAFLANDNLANIDRAKIHFSIAKLENQDKNYNEEVIQLRQANHCVMEDTAINFAKMRTEQRAMVERFATWNKENSLPTTDKQNAITPIFICSMPRSGSSLLENILSKDASIKSSAESATLFSTLRRFSKISGETPITLLEPDALARHRDQLLRCHAEILQLYQIDTERFIDKSMENFLDVGRILMLYPNAKIIHLNRNPLDVCMSCYQFLFENGKGNEYIYSLAETARQISHFDDCMARWAAVFPNSILPVEYETLVTEPDSELARVAAFVGIDKPDLNEDQRKNDTVLTFSTWQVRAKINTGAINKWHHYREHLLKVPELAALAD